MKSAKKDFTRLLDVARWALFVSPLPLCAVAPGCVHNPIGCPEELTISGTLDIPFEPDRELTIRLCTNAACETVNGVRDSVGGVPGDEPGVNPEFPTLAAEADFTNTPEQRRVSILFQGAHDSDDDYSVDIWLENGDHIVQAMFEDVDRDHCYGVSREL